MPWLEDLLESDPLGTSSGDEQEMGKATAYRATRSTVLLLTVSLSLSWVDFVEFGVVFSSASVTRLAPCLLIEQLHKGNFSYEYDSLYGMRQTSCLGRIIFRKVLYAGGIWMVSRIKSSSV